MVAKPYCPWKSHLFQIEKEQNCEGRTIYVVYEDDRDGSWRLQVCYAATLYVRLFNECNACAILPEIVLDSCQSHAATTYSITWHLVGRMRVSRLLIA